MLEIQSLALGNNIYLWLVIIAFFSALSSFIGILAFIQIFKVKYSKMAILISVLVDSFVSILCMIHTIIPIIMVLYIIVLFFIYKFIFKQSIEKSIVGVLFNVIIVAIIELIFSRIFLEMYPNINIFVHKKYKYKYNLWLILGICFAKFIVYAIVKTKKLSINMDDYLRKKIKYSITATSIITISIYSIIEVTMHSMNFSNLIFSINILLLILIAYLYVKLILKIAMLGEMIQKIHNLETYNKTLASMYDGLRGFRHDYANFIQALNGYVQVGDLDGVKKLSEAVTKDCVSIKNMGIINCKVINNPAVYNLIIEKYYSAQSKNIQMNVEVMIDINSIKMSVYELCRILGILIDNAIEAAEKCEDKVINIRFIKDLKVDRKLIIIENSYFNKEVDVEKIFEKGISSKDNINKEHGLGLWIIRNILRKNENVNLYTTKGELFCQQLEVYES